VTAAPYQRCSCRDPGTGRQLGRRCPKLGAKGHGLGWFYRYEAPPRPGGGRRQPEVEPFATRKAAEEDQVATLARLAGGGQVQDRSLKTGKFLRDHADAKIDLKTSSQAAIREAMLLYWIPAIGHHRLVDLRDHHISEAIREMLKINRPDAQGEKPSETLQRLIAARADDVRRDLAPGEKRHKKSSKPLSASRIQRIYAVLHAALQTAVPKKIPDNPSDGVILPRPVKVRPLPWTADRETAFRKALARSTAAATGARDLTTVERQRLWADPRLRPSPVMV
jgi:hypothetical protein